MKTLILTLAAFLAALSAHAVPTYHISRTADGLTTDIPGATLFSASGGARVDLPPRTIFGAFDPNGAAVDNHVPYFLYSFFLAGPESPKLYNHIRLGGPGGPATWHYVALGWVFEQLPLTPPDYDYPWPILDSVRMPLLSDVASPPYRVWSGTVVVEDLRRVRVPDQSSTFSLLAVAALGLVGFSRRRFRSV